jgi:diguanylate cyclase (GGDEF)-like protein
MRSTIERRASLADEFKRQLPWPLRLTRPGSGRWVVAGALLTLLADAVTGPDVWFGPFYLVAIGMAAWSLGWRQAIGIGLLCLAATMVANGAILFPYKGPAAFWNLAMRLLSIVLVIVLLHSLRKCYASEWRLARTDPLTGTLNRQAFFELVGACTHSRGWTLLAYADLDGMKQLNDGHGHAAGDDSLVAYSRQVTKAIRQDDVFARVGGDEFLIHMRIKDEASAKAVAARLHRVMNEVLAQGATPLRCSLGVLISAPGARSIDREIRMADELMYEAKLLGGALSLATVSERFGKLEVTRDWTGHPLLDGQRRGQAGGRPAARAQVRTAGLKEVA